MDLLLLILCLGLILLPTSARPRVPETRSLLHHPDDALGVHPGVPPASPIRAEVPTSEGDRAALVEIYQSTNGPGWLNSSGWLEGDPCLDAWLGVGCGEDGRVTTLGNYNVLWDNNMTGSLPPAINDLTALITLDLTLNPIGGELPPIGDLRGLEILYLQGNNFEGPLPPLDNLTSLVELSLVQNSFSGSLPPLTNFTELQYLGLRINMFTGTVPSSYSNLTSLINLDLSSNALSGALPPLDSLHDLQYLNLYDNMFTGTVPSSYSNLTSLNILDLHFNALSGALPPLDSLHDLQDFDLSDNMFTGPLPDIANFPDLVIFLAYNNDFSSALPPSVFSLPKLEAVILSGNPKLKGTLPAVLDAPSLTSLVIEGCDLSGPLPTSIASNLTALYLAGNRLESTIPPLPPTIVDVSLAYNELSGSLSDDFFADTPDLETFDIRHNKIGGSIPTSMSSLEHLADLKTDLNYMSGSLAANMESWPIFAASDTSSTTSTILFGNIWSCPIEPAIRDHSDDEAHAYACGDSEFVTPILVAAAAFALFAAAAAFTKHENVYRLVCYYSRSKTAVLTDARKLVNVGYSCYKLVAAVLLASFGLSATYWNAHSAFDTQPALLKLSATLKTASDGFILPLLAITTLTLLYYIRWGWGMRFEGRVESELTGSGKPRSWRGTVKLAWLVARVMGTATVFDFVYVFFVATNPRMSTSTRTLLNALLSQFKSSFLNERAAAKQALKLADPAKRFNYLVFTMSAIMLLNALVVPSVLVLLLDERCFKFYDFWLLGRLQIQAPHDAVVPYTYCQYVDTDGNRSCPDPNNPNDGYVTVYYSTTFEYPWSLSEQCGSAVIQSYSPVVLSELTLSLILQPAMWWLCTDHSHSHASKWAILSAGLFVSLGLPNTVSMFADDIDAGLGGWAILPIAIGVFSAFVLAAWLLKKLGPTAASPTPSWSYLPPVDYLLDLFDYNVDEDRLLGQKATYTWPLQDRFSEHVQGFGSSALDFLGFARGNFASEYDGLIDDAFRDGPEEEEEEDEDEEEAAPLYRKDRYGINLPHAYANLVKTTALILTFGLAAPLTAWVGCLGLLARWLTMSYLAERWRRKEEEGGRGGLVTDAQGLPFRCVVLVVVTVLAFFGTAAVLSGVGGEASAWTWVGLGAMAGVLGAQTWLIGRETVRKAARSAARSSDLREPLLDADDLAAAADNE